ncbi:MAG: multidrug efflux protein [Verrucomicrobia bacterium]|nr:MAG: multidrug efflux protein [Verrucomicrobiota bacterium]
MKFTDIFIRRPVAATVISLMILLAGFQSLRSLLLNVREYPRTETTVISIATTYTGASAELVRSHITTFLEKAISDVDGIDYVESSSAQNKSTITVHLRLNFDVYKALTHIQAKIAQIRNHLPSEAEAPVIEIKTGDTQIALLYLSFSSRDLDSNQITDFLNRVIQPKLTALTGIQKAEILGEQTFAMRVWLKPDHMAALHIAPSDVTKALTANHYAAAIGSTKGTMTTAHVVANTDLRNVEEFRQLVVAQRNGAMIRLKDIADVELGAEDYNEIARFDGETAIFIGIWGSPTVSPLDITQAVRKALPELQALLLPGMKCEIEYDSTDYIRDAFHEVTKTLLEALVVVVIVMFLFLGSVRSVLIPVIAIPISLIGTAFLVALAGFSMNLLTLLAVVLAVGLVVDDAIVVVENIERHIRTGLPPLEAALRGARELIGPIIAMTITLAAVYAPIGIQGGLTGALFREFAFTLAAAVIVSGIVALTLAPMMSVWLLRFSDHKMRFCSFLDHWFAALKEKYARTLTWSLGYRSAFYVLWGFAVISAVFFYKFSTKELAPREDEGFIDVPIQTGANSTLDQTDLFARQLNAIYHAIPEVKHTLQIISSTSGFVGVTLKPFNQRKRSIDQTLADISEENSKIAGIDLFAMTPAPLPGADQFPIEFVIGAPAELQEMLPFAENLVQKARKSGLFSFIDTNLKYDQPEYRVHFDRDKVATLGIDLQRSGRDLNAMLAGGSVSRFSNQGHSYKVIPQIKRIHRLNPDQLADIYMGSQDGKLVKLSTFAHISRSVQPRELTHFQQLHSVTIQGSPTSGVSMESALSFLERDARKILPAGYVIDYAGESRQLRKEGDRLLGTMVLSLIFIFLVLAAQFESFRDPLIVLFGSAPLAITGALLMPFMGFSTLNIYTQISIITLIGLITKNGILIVEFANKLQESGLDKFQAVIEAASIRLRPILMTTLSTVVGSLPLILFRGPGAGARNSIGAVIVSGMVIGTFFTLFCVPAIYTLIAKTRRKASLQQLLPSSTAGDAPPPYQEPAPVI